jgi:hypothetical protein
MIGIETLLNQLSRRVSTLVGSTLAQKLGRAAQGLGGSSFGVGSSPLPRATPAGSAWLQRAFGGKSGFGARALLGGRRKLADMTAARAAKRYKASRRRMLAIPVSDVSRRKAAALQAGRDKQVMQRAEARRNELYKPGALISPASLITSRLHASRPDQFRPDASRLTGSPSQMVGQMLAMAKERSAARADNTNWLQSRQSPLAQVARAKELAEKAASRFQNLSARRNALGTVLDAAKARLASAPTKGMPGFDAARTASLTKQVGIVSQTFKAADARAAGALGKLAQSSALYARATSISANAMRFLGAGFAKVAGPIGIGLTAAYMAVKAPTWLAEAADRQVESRRWMTNYSMGSRAAFATYDLSTQNVQHRQAEAMNSSTQAMITQQNRFRENLVPFKSFMGNLGNAIWTSGLQQVNDKFTMAEQLGIGLEALNQGKFFDPKFWAESNKELEAMKAADRNKFDTTFSDTLRALSHVTDQKKDARNNNSRKDTLPPLR